MPNLRSAVSRRARTRSCPAPARRDPGWRARRRVPRRRLSCPSAGSPRCIRFRLWYRSSVRSGLRVPRSSFQPPIRDAVRCPEQPSAVCETDCAFRQSGTRTRGWQGCVPSWNYSPLGGKNSGAVRRENRTFRRVSGAGRRAVRSTTSRDPTSAGGCTAWLREEPWCVDALGAGTGCRGTDRRTVPMTGMGIPPSRRTHSCARPASIAMYV